MGEKKKFGQKAWVEWFFPWQKGAKVEVVTGQQVKIGEVLFLKEGEKFLSPVDGKVLEINNKKREVILGFKAFEFRGDSLSGAERVWAEVVVGEDSKTLDVNGVEGKIVIFSFKNLILMAKMAALGVKGAIFFGAIEVTAEDFLSGLPAMTLKEKEKEKFLSILKLMERPVVHLDTKMARLLLTENKKV